ncbi:hypothetical protein BT69DRAFT_995402 [Atractiella rhizophila]|nr:hypothetical protein BT69DRAFT_995402 [Atractiella rhizophila]
MLVPVAIVTVTAATIVVVVSTSGTVSGCRRGIGRGRGRGSRSVGIRVLEHENQVCLRLRKEGTLTWTAKQEPNGPGPFATLSVPPLETRIKHAMVRFMSAINRCYVG